MKGEEILMDLSEEIVADMDNWNKDNPGATFLEIEEKARDLVSKLEVALIQKSALEREEDSWKDAEERERPTCPSCKMPLVSRGKRVRSLQGSAGKEIKLKRNYGTCPQCGTSFFPPR
jgi:ribosomal protein S27AE